MGRLSAKLRSVKGGYVAFWCPGCRGFHSVRVEGANAWKFDGNADAPTFSDSVLVTSGHYLPDYKLEEACWCTWTQRHPDKPVPFRCMRCHSFVEAGMIRFLGDCTHGLAGRTVPLPDVPE